MRSALLSRQTQAERNKSGAGQSIKRAANPGPLQQDAHAGDGHGVTGQPGEGHRREHQPEQRSPWEGRDGLQPTWRVAGRSRLMR